MTDEQAASLTEDQTAPWLSTKLFGTAVIVVVSLATVFYVVLRLQATYAMETELALLHLEVQHQAAEIQAFKEQTNKILSDIAVTAYGPLSQAQRRPMVTEAWSRNRDRELRARIHQLEMWRLRAGQ